VRRSGSHNPQVERCVTRQDAKFGLQQLQRVGMVHSLTEHCEELQLLSQAPCQMSSSFNDFRFRFTSTGIYLQPFHCSTHLPRA
jgi:hypothetical protein